MSVLLSRVKKKKEDGVLEGGICVLGTGGEIKLTDYQNQSIAIKELYATSAWLDANVNSIIGTLGVAKKNKKKNNNLYRPMSPSGNLRVIIGDGPTNNVDAVKGVWNYIKKNKLQYKSDRRFIQIDYNLGELAGMDPGTLVSMFDLPRIITRNLTPLN